MTNSPEIERSRIIAATQQLAGIGALPGRLASATVVVSGNATDLASANGRTMLRTAVRLLPRIATHVIVSIPAEPTLEDANRNVRAIAAAVELKPPIQFREHPLDDTVIVLWIGANAPALKRTICISSRGWLAAVSRGGGFPALRGNTNAIAATAAAALGVAEVFKCLVEIPAAIRAPIQTIWSLDTYGTECAYDGPVLPSTIDVDAVLLGCGAIGNGVALTLDELGATVAMRGRLGLVDRQVFTAENWGTCALIGPCALGEGKAEWLRDDLRQQLTAESGHQLSIQAYSGALEARLEEIERAAYEVAISAADNSNSRRLLQTLWPDLVLDAALGETEVQLHRHTIDGADACLRCWYPPDTRGELQEALVERLSGVPRELQRVPNAIVSDELMAECDEISRRRLQPFLGRSICSIISEATLTHLRDGNDLGFAPSLPFVAVLAGAMLVGELVKHAANIGTPVDGSQLIDALCGPATGFSNPMDRRATCDCVRRRDAISQMRFGRRPRGRKTSGFIAQ